LFQNVSSEQVTSSRVASLKRDPVQYSSRIPFLKGRPPHSFLVPFRVIILGFLSKKGLCFLHFFFIPSDNSDRIAGDGGGGEQLGEVLLHPESGGTHVRPLVDTLSDQTTQVPQALAKTKHPYKYLCTYDLYSPVHNVLDACISITRGSGGGGWALEISSFLGPVKWYRADRRVPFIRNQQQTVRRIKGRSGAKNKKIPLEQNIENSGWQLAMLFNKRVK
jgi:hypothetical protein